MDNQITLLDEGGTMAENDLCMAVSDTLMSHYPGYAWGVGCIAESGMVAIRLAVPLSDVAGQQASPGFYLRISTLMGAGGQKRVVEAGGEILERWKLNRGKAPADWVDAAWENGLDKSHMIVKSKH